MVAFLTVHNIWNVALCGSVSRPTRFEASWCLDFQGQAAKKPWKCRHSFKILRTITQQQCIIFHKPGTFLDRARWISIQKRLETTLHKPLDKRKKDIPVNNEPTHFRCCFMLSVPKNSQGAPNCDRTVQLFEALPPRCHRIETHLKKYIYVYYVCYFH